MTRRRIQEYRRNLECDPGINTELLLEIQQYLKGERGEARSVILSFDGMSADDGIFTKFGSGELSGMEDLGDLVTYTREKMDATEIKVAKECMQLMVTSVTGKFRVPIGYYMVQSATAGLIAEMVDRALIDLDKINVHVRVVIPDGAPEHRAWQKKVACYVDENPMWHGDANAAKFKVGMKHPNYPFSRDKMVILMSDPVHLVKKLVRNLHSSGFEKGKSKLLLKDGEHIHWKQLVHAFEQDQKLPNPIAQKITRAHLDRSSFTGLKTRYSTQLMSASNQRSVQKHSKLDEKPNKQLLQYMFLADRYIDIMNSGKQRASWFGEAKAHLNHPIRESSDQRLRQLAQTVWWFDQWHAENERLPAASPAERKKRFISEELYYDIRLAIRGFIMVADILCETQTPVIPRLYNQDCVENHFSLLRASAGARTHIKAHEMPSSQSAVLVQTSRGGLVGSGNVTADHNSVDENIAMSLRSRHVVRKDRAKRRKIGQDLFAAAGIVL